jgi:hypothetical protein
MGAPFGPNTDEVPGLDLDQVQTSSRLHDDARGFYIKVMKPGEGRYVVIGERARCTFKVSMAKRPSNYAAFASVVPR